MTMETGVVRILLIDDDEDDFIITRDLLLEVESSRFKLDWVSSYDDAIRAVELGLHDLYLIDYRLGANNGLDLLRWAVANGCSIPMILLTGQGDEDIDVAAMESGAIDYLIKGQINSTILERSIRYALERNRVEQRLAQKIDELERVVEERETLARIGRIVSSSLNIDEVYGSLVEQVRKLIPADRVTINLINMESQTATQAWILGSDVPGRRLHETMPLLGTLTNEVVQRRAGLIIQSDDEEEMIRQYPGLRPAVESGLWSFLSVPMISNDQIIGVLHLRAVKANRYTGADLALAQSIADQIAGAITTCKGRRHTVPAGRRDGVPPELIFGC